MGGHLGVKFLNRDRQLRPLQEDEVSLDVPSIRRPVLVKIIAS